ncbi:MAG: ATP-binding protein [Candidatus Aminicenantia bacterium]
MKDIKLKLRTKFTLAILTVVLIFGSINIILIRKSTLKALREELENRGLFIVQSLAERSTEFLLYEDYISLQQLVDEIKDLDKDVVYSFITDNQGKVIVHTFEHGFPVELIQANPISKEKNYNVQLIYDKNKKFLYRDIAVPILDGEIGIVRVGIAEKNIARQTNKAITILTGMVIVFLIIGIVGAFIFAYLITNPISKIVDVSETLNLDEKAEPIRVKTYDEIEYLANKFNEMVQRLQSAHQELKNAQEKLIQTEKLASIGTLASGLTHEINNPLAGLKNCLNRIKKTPDKNEILKYINLMFNALEKIENVVRGLLDFSRKRDYNFESISINEVIERAYSLVQYQLENNSIKVKKDLDETIGLCKGDAHQLEQVMVNLILNSIDAMPKRGGLILKTFQNKNKVYIIVEDTGIGISGKHLNKIFDPFFTTKETGKGTGLGLSVSYNIIKAHRGEILVESQEGKGTKLTVSLPVYSPEMSNSQRKTRE